MLTNQEVLARERMRECATSSRSARLAREMAAERRWRRLSRMAHAAEERHARAADRLAQY